MNCNQSNCSQVRQHRYSYMSLCVVSLNIIFDKFSLSIFIRRSNTNPTWSPSDTLLLTHYDLWLPSTNSKEDICGLWAAAEGGGLSHRTSWVTKRERRTEDREADCLKLQCYFMGTGLSGLQGITWCYTVQPDPLPVEFMRCDDDSLSFCPDCPSLQRRHS